MSETLDELKKRLAEQEAKTDFWRRATLTLISHTVDTAEYEGMRSGTSNTALERYWSICRECLEICLENGIVTPQNKTFIRLKAISASSC